MLVRDSLSQSDSKPNSRFLSYLFVDFFSELNIVLEDQVIWNPLVSKKVSLKYLPVRSELSSKSTLVYLYLS